jgi:hypothetical protein
MDSNYRLIPPSVNPVRPRTAGSQS